MWYGLLGALAAIVVLVLLAALTKPDRFRVERQIRITAPPDRPYALVSNFRRWADWSPWEKLDPDMQRTFGGPEAGVGASYAWDGKGAAGAGRMEIVNAAEPHRLTIQLDFLRPFASRNTTFFSFADDGGSTLVTWTMEGPSLFVSKVMQVFVSLDTMIGKDFEAGLEKMKAVAEA